MPVEPTRRVRDPAQLTPYEEKLLELRRKGLTYKQMSEALNGTSGIRTIISRYKIIKEKLELLEYQDA